MATADHVMIRATTSSQAIGELKVKMTSSKNVLWCGRDGGAASPLLVWLLIGEKSLDFEFAGCLLITFSPSKAREMQCYHRNKRVTPSLNPFRPQLIVREDDGGNTQIWQQRASLNCVKLDHTGSKNTLKPSPQEKMKRNPVNNSLVFTVLDHFKVVLVGFGLCPKNSWVKVSEIWFLAG